MKGVAFASGALCLFFSLQIQAFAAPAFQSKNDRVIRAECEKVPTKDEVRKGEWRYIDRKISAAQAAKLGIPVVNVSGSHDLTLIVRDYRRAESCTTADEKFEIWYGQVVRTVIEIEGYDASIGFSFPVIAASGTISNKTQNFYFYKDGFFNSEIDSAITAVSGKTFDVENYATFNSVMPTVINLLNKPETEFSVNKLLVVPLSEAESNAPLVAYALQTISQRISCEKAKSKFSRAVEDEAVVEGAYLTFTNQCSTEKPTEIEALTVKPMLRGLRIK
ncbi:hypothetical protein [Hyphococcus sp.]|uniref:hypothetical protein n=1 Tax=Hyphococcus sp. TaxID=2038636 RepID=UPI00208547FC|nr:MAG: hypothetical protein DHS20C04_14740 [Marinicaulis sp.]